MLKFSVYLNRHVSVMITFQAKNRVRCNVCKSNTVFTLLCFRHFSESQFFFFFFFFFFFCLALYTEVVNLQTFVMILCKTINRKLPMHKTFFFFFCFFFSGHWFLKTSSTFSFSIMQWMQLMPKYAG